MAILAGDALLTHAFYLVSTTPDRCPNVSPATALAITKELSIFAGAMGMVGGQAADILSVQGETDLERLDYIHTHKTADLIVFSLRAGGLIGGARPQQLQALEIFGQSIGLAFQIQDDILDIIGDQHKLGKKTKSDETQNKVTYPYLMGLDQSIQKVEQLTRLGKEALLDGAIPQPQRLLLLAEYLMSRDF
jgi:geranylgeranyl diphosphate synthase type II